jgi:formylglycine-generating enzyme required for sulfatase activity
MRTSNFYSLLLLLLPFTVWANNLQISGVSATTTTVTFNIQWDNSWNIENLSRDAAWVFVKFQDCGTANKSWDHCNLSTNSASHSVTGGVLRVDAVTDGRGVFIYRSAFGGGNNTSAAVTLTFATPFADISAVNFDVVGIEMVFVPQGSFQAGDGSSVRTFGTNQTLTVPTISSEASIAVDALASATNNNIDGTRHPIVPASFPKGFNAFYCMKYEISQSQYVHFLNTLPSAQQATRTAVSPSSAANTSAMHTGLTHPNVRRNWIRIQTPASGAPSNPAVYGMNRNNNGVYNEADDGGNVACSFLSWGDLLAYLDWSALRPMTELEYEKSCRGPATAGPFSIGMYAWGNTQIVQAVNTSEVTGITGAGTASETSTAVGNGLCCYSLTATSQGPYRVGFAANAASSRSQSGATYYGIMEMSGNVMEQCMMIGRTHTNASYPPLSYAAVFDGTLGDGMLDVNGDANPNTWNISEYRYSVLRGGSIANSAPQLQVSDRNYLYPYQTPGVIGAGWQNDQRQYQHGGRGVRQF